jgi:putative spermidine/putrescine transport system permease protein
MSDESDIPVAFKVITGIVLVLLLAPIVIVVLISFTTADSFRLPTDGLSLQWLERFWDTESLRSSFLYSTMVAFFAAIMATAAGTAAAMWLVRALKEGRRSALAVIAILLLPIIMPGVAVGFAIFVFYHDLSIPRTTLGLVLAQAAVTMPFVVIVATAGLYRLDTELGLAARSLGAGAWTTFRRVTLPLALPSLTSGFLFAFLLSFGTGQLSRYITPTDESTFPVALYAYLLFKLDPTPAAAGTISIVMAVVTVVLLNWLTPLGRLSARGD